MIEMLPEWITAVAAVGALAAAIAAGLTARRLYNIERRRDRARGLTDERRQADQVAAWVSWTNHPAVALHLPDGRTQRVHLALRNSSAVPVYDIVVTFHADGEEYGSQEFPMLSPTGDETHHREIKLDDVRTLVGLPRAKDKRLDIRVVLEFTDAAGTRWSRDASGALSRLTT